MGEPKPVVFVVDDDVAVREGVGSLARSVRLEVQTFDSAQEFLAAKRTDAPACLVLDVRLPGPSGLDLQRNLRRSGVAIPIIFLTGYADVPMTVRAMKEGAIEFLIKPFRNQDLLDAIHRALEQSRSERHQRVALAQLRRRFDSLTPREKQVMGLVVTGLPNRRIAKQLGAKEATVKIHRGRVMQKMRAASLPELVRIAQQLAPSDSGA